MRNGLVAARQDQNRRWTVAPRFLLSLSVILAIAVFVAGAFYLTRPGARDYRYLLDGDEKSSSAELDAAARLRVERFCGDCHALPRPDSFPRDAWHEGVTKGYEFYAKSGRSDLDPPPFYETLAYYRSQAPLHLEFPSPVDLAAAPPVVFEIETIKLGQTDQVAPAIACLRFLRLAADETPQLIACDMRAGGVTAIDLQHPKRSTRLLAQLNNPCRVEPCDLDGDKLLDLVVADLGSFFPSDHDLGRIVWLRRRADSPAYEIAEIRTKMGRVADVRPVDFDGDGVVDLVAAEFGADRTGGIYLLRNVQGRGQPPQFESRRLDDRPGTIHTPVHDFNGDGRPDFAALLSQEHEQIDLFLNSSNGPLVRRTLWAAPDLTFASSGIELVDMDQDGDMDILYTNGDAFDNSYLSPSHGVQWLEQREGLQFVDHRLAALPGAYRALAGDLDLDGDLDVVASVWLPPQVRPANVARETLASIILLQQTAPGRFASHVLEIGAPHHAALEMADFDGDGDLDVAAGQHILSSRARNTQQASHHLAIWWNQTIADQPKDSSSLLEN